MPSRRVVVSALVLTIVAIWVSAGVGATTGATSQPLLRLVPPPDGQAYYGFTFRTWDTSDPAWGDVRSFADRIAESIQTELGGKRPAWITVWESWQKPNDPGKPMSLFSEVQGDIQKVQAVTDPNGLLYLDWNLTQTTPQNGGVTVKDIATGAVDDYVKEYARQIKAYRKPVLIRLFGGEFNGNWWYGQSPWANPALTAADFVAAWRRVVDIFRKEGTLNAAWAWIPTVANASWGSDPNVAPYYPGDDYVDWAGADTADLWTPQGLDPLYAFAVAHGKPFFLAEFMLRHGGSLLAPPQQRDWLNAMFDYFESHPDIKAINYFDYNSRSAPYDPARVVYLDGGQVNYQANTNDDDGRLIADSGADFRGTYARRISSSRYVSAIVTAPAAEQAATVTLVTSAVHRRAAKIVWRGNDMATTYDLAVQRGTSRWQTVASGVTGTTFTLKGAPGQRVEIRVRARDDIGQPGPWSSPSRITFRGP